MFLSSILLIALLILSTSCSLSIGVLSNSTAKIAFIASGNQKMIKNLYAIYKEVERDIKGDESK